MGFKRNRSKNFQNHLYGQPVLTFDERQIFIERLNRVTLQHNKEFIVFIFFIEGFFITMCNLKKCLICAAF